MMIGSTQKRVTRFKSSEEQVLELMLLQNEEQAYYTTIINEAE